MSEPKFTIGRGVATVNVLERVAFEEICQALLRHFAGDWGDVEPDDWAANDQALLEGDRLLSVYHARDQTKFWIITEADRSATTVLLPEDY